ncbi:MAG: grasp-with-spasm system ATP-grasp peptide maturase [Bacteroidota bacterium]
MLLIITSEHDHSTLMVIDWLNHFDLPWIRINEKDVIEVSFHNDDIEFRSPSFSFLLSDLKAVWYRRGFLNFKLYITKLIDIDEFKKIELEKLREYIYYKLAQLPHINRFKNADVNKLIVTETARSVGLTTPQEYLVSTKTYLNEILESKETDFATKSISGYGIIPSDFVNYNILTKKINSTEKTPQKFFPSLVQHYIEKRYELRIFYMHRKFWAMAIFSQNDDTTAVDFRNYNDKKPNRNVPFTVPIHIQQKIIALMEKLDLNCGSIDMIVTPQLEFIFLEVNPVGQYGMVSRPCNYYLHRELALHLKQLSHE